MVPLSFCGLKISSLVSTQRLIHFFFCFNSVTVLAVSIVCYKSIDYCFKLFIRSDFEGREYRIFLVFNEDIRLAVSGRAVYMLNVISLDELRRDVFVTKTFVHLENKSITIHKWWFLMGPAKSIWILFQTAVAGSHDIAGLFRVSWHRTQPPTYFPICLSNPAHQTYDLASA